MIQNIHPGSRIRILIFYPSRIPDPGVKKTPDPWSATLLNPDPLLAKRRTCSFQLRFTQAKEVETLGKKMAATNKTLQTRDTKIIELEQQLEDANR